MAKVVVGMIGLGTVGSGVVSLLAHQRQVVLKKIAVRDLNKARSVKAPCPITTNVDDVINDPEIEILIEVMGGDQPALDYIRAAINKRKHVVTANKEVLAKHGPELFALAREKGVTIFFEASVAGGIPLISTMQKGLEANEVLSVTGILNGTTNYILSCMQESGQAYEEALAGAQALGFAEADPTSDVDGHDVAYKLSILSALAFDCFVNPSDIYKEGIRKVSSRDMADAREFGYCIKLIGLTRRQSGGTDKPKGERSLDVRVHPMLVPLNHALSSVSDGNNGILVRGSAVGEIVMVGPGAGQMPTASAIVGDCLNLASALQLPDFAAYFSPHITSDWANVARAFTCPYYLRLTVKDVPGVFGKLGTIFGDNGINMQTIVQRKVSAEANGKAKDFAQIVVITGEVEETSMNQAIDELKKSNFLKDLESVIRIFQPRQENA